MGLPRVQGHKSLRARCSLLGPSSVCCDAQGSKAGVRSGSASLYKKPMGPEEPGNKEVVWNFGKSRLMWLELGL